MSVFADTSAFLAVLTDNDVSHLEADRVWAALGGRRESVVSTNYVLVETVSLLHARFGVHAARRFVETVVPVLTIDWIGPEAHESGIAAVLASGRRGPSLVDCTSFEVMRRRGITEAFAFDSHFADRGYRLPPVGIDLERADSA